MNISLTALRSRASRELATGSPGGIRKFGLNLIKTTNPETQNPTTFWGGLKRFSDSLLNGLTAFADGILSFNLSGLWSAVVTTGLKIVNFNWNVTDAQLDQRIKQAEIAINGAYGGLIGGTLGYAICGLIPTATIAVFNEALALHVLEELGEEAAEEIAAKTATWLQLVFKQYIDKGFVNLYKNYRSVLRPAALSVAQLLVRAGILTQESVDEANKNRNKPWSFHSALESSIESIQDPAQQAYAEEFWEELTESCIEAGYIVAAGIDSYFAKARIANSNILGRERVVEIQPIRDPATT